MTCDNCKPTPLKARQEAERLLRIGEQMLNGSIPMPGNPYGPEGRMVRCQMAEAYASLAIGWAQVADDE